VAISGALLRIPGLNVASENGPGDVVALVEYLRSVRLDLAVERSSVDATKPQYEQGNGRETSGELHGCLCRSALRPKLRVHLPFEKAHFIPHRRPGSFV